MLIRIITFSEQQNKFIDTIIRKLKCVLESLFSILNQFYWNNLYCEMNISIVLNCPGHFDIQENNHNLYI